MSYMILPLIITLSLLFLRLSHPLSVGLALLVQTTLVSATSGLTNKTFWFSYILFLVFLGGMLVLFIYVASLASNEQFNFNPQQLIYMLFFMIMSAITLFLLDPLLLSNKLISPYLSVKSELTAYITSTIYNLPSYFFTLFIIMYLLLTLLVIVKTMKMFSGTLRMSN
uniref:NADH-ubiquinone oxidoreductase chain 6 n=1 Tax=Lomis hirta TaxID=177234 RepID=A0A3S6JA65_9EUCA|nr:NADH dehydrogenase subunit 6 [Lomis hirta]